MEVAPFFVDFHHLLSIFTIFYRFSRFTHFCRDYNLSRFTHFFRNFFLAKTAFPATSHVFCTYAFLLCDLKNTPVFVMLKCSKVVISILPPCLSKMCFHNGLSAALLWRHMSVFRKLGPGFVIGILEWKIGIWHVNLAFYSMFLNFWEVYSVL